MDMALKSGAGANSTVTLAIAQRVVLQNPGGAVGNLSPQPQKRQEANATSSANGETASTAEPSASASADSAGASGNSTSNSTETALPEATQTASGDSAASSASAATDGATPTDAASASSTPASQDPASQQGGGAAQAQNPAATQLLLAPTFATISSTTVIDAANGRIAAPVSQVDGEFIITMQMATGGGVRAASQGGVTMSMGELTSMIERQQNGGVMPVWSMMSELQSQQRSQAPVVPQRARRSRL
jgi:hypothetical protein